VAVTVLILSVIFGCGSRIYSNAYNTKSHLDLRK
jgi:hypothetical protein